MNPELDKKLCEAFPILYQDRDAPMQTTCMCWGFPGDGWFQLIWDLSEKLEKIIAGLPESEHRPKAVQVKEKFGFLHYYLTAGTEEMRKLVREAEELSMKTCEDCGKKGRVRNDIGWILTLCTKCWKKHKDARIKK